MRLNGFEFAVEHREEFRDIANDFEYSGTGGISPKGTALGLHPERISAAIAARVPAGSDHSGRYGGCSAVVPVGRHNPGQ